MTTTATAPTGLRERKRAATAAQIHQAAMRLVDEHGYEAVTVAQIADMADVSPKTVFNHWGSKDGAVLGIHAVGPDPAWASAYLEPTNTDPFGPLLDSLITHAERRTREHSQRMLRVFQENPHLDSLRFAYVQQRGEALATLCAQKLRQLEPGQSETAALSKARLITAIALAVTRHAWLEWAGSTDPRPLRAHLAASRALHQELCHDVFNISGEAQ